MDGKSNINWIVKNNDVDDVTDSISNGFMIEDSMCSSFSSSEMDDDDDQEASSSSTFSLSPSSNLHGPLYELSELMNQLPIKRGLSMFYQGKAQSFGSLARVESIEDLPKKEKPNYRNKMKSCKSFGLCTPKTIIAKKSLREPCLTVISSRRKGFFGGSRCPISLNKNF